MAELWDLDAVAAVAALRRGEVSPAEMLDAVAGRVAEIDPLLNALPTLCLERAMDRMRAAGPALRETPLAGLPVAIKDSADVAGVRTTRGSRVFAERVPERSDLVVEAIEAAGGIVFAKSNTPEFEAGASTFNEVFGRTLNPWDLSRSPAGSSGGAAAAVASGMAHLAQGADFACSLRYPAAFCGVVGLRPTPGLVPQGPGAMPWQTLSVSGPVARNVADAGLGLAAMARFDPRDPLSTPATAFFAAAARRPVKPLRIGWSEDLGIARVDPEIRGICAAAIGRLAAEGSEVVPGHPDLSDAPAAFLPLRAALFAGTWGGLLEGPERALLKPEVVWNIEQGLASTARDLARAEAARARVRQAMLGHLERVDVLITPTAPVPPFPAGDRHVAEIDGVRMETYLDWLVLGYAVSAAGCPAISIPCGWTGSGLPVGIQLIGRPHDEARLLSRAAWCEAVLGCRLDMPVTPSGTASRIGVDS